VSQVLEQQKIFNVFMRFDDDSRANLERIQQTVIKIMPDGRKVRLEEVADIYEAEGPNQINRENAQRRIVISANSSGRDLDSLVREIQSKVQKVEIPEGYFVQYGGQFESQQSASRLILFLGLLSLIGIFVVLYAHFKSSFIAVQIMLNIPMALIGSLIAIFLTDRIFSIATLIAFITLCGIASRNGIMMISHYLHLMKFEDEKFTKEMVIRGSLERLVPVLMTALTAVLGLLPLVLAGAEPGKEILHPVAVVIVGGLISSTLLDMFLTPVVFYHFGQKSAEKNINYKKLELT
jgi:Cu/Ag efflux pump CusA